ncbi:Immunoglobulin subtype 2 domain and Immunoglobulin subtype domain and Immunoglobulin-like domain and Immunoglobulin I-set domain and Immunoglobulin-like fold domain-containing protein [Strongyloides ratti]|uniref:Immunoglobulin subtype 2 domain and Immunoglobulin subtype domain and Immunoglobulin-like domain and Immunoglobulin I-set domain and Immunoglobulin-like fold domain-containing protein n=1 Tax=Strongyloides ratti TaxID=34506 RepID=A0A090LMA5_STRRB|nr:Immunoglobulin subtype 2 domain and Immunoglobulin subtype domain and Immunoglobulin-like domain and Immunoglobulin I-set domain and Immunoglobulin-like fold domain-containing protein [Strongyloides ratti]CEF70985.1 Immunoglobulin subtype 2 domain and Immunoglobulin subtype domain and Immunoglobulin-like domain and Immunoglobulin I-set domain and Immunoglobulin-like fold domain-containing protein [Strongyloides ratti]
MARVIVLKKDEDILSTNEIRRHIRRIRIDKNRDNEKGIVQKVVLPRTSKHFIWATSKRNEVPEFTFRMQDQWHFEGDNIALRVTFNGVPKPEIYWFKDHQPIIPSMKTMINSSDNLSELIIFNAEKNDSGFYTCRIENNLGIRESHAQIYIKGNDNIKCLRTMPRRNYLSERLYRPMYHEISYYSRY